MNPLKSVIAAGALALFAAAAPPAAASVLFQSVADLTVKPEYNGFCSACSGKGRAFDAFSVAADATAESVTFAVHSGFAYPTDVTVDIYAGGVPAAPGALIFSHTYAPADFAGVFDTLFNTTLVTVDLPGVELLAGVAYVFSYYNPQNLGAPAYTGGGGQFYLADYGRIGRSLGFRFESADSVVPEPATWAMMILGFGAAGCTLRRRRDAPA